MARPGIAGDRDGALNSLGVSRKLKIIILIISFFLGYIFNFPHTANIWL
jgi:hypothetical protein